MESTAVLPRPLSAQAWLQAIWRVADPKFTLASVAALLLGGAAAARDGAFSWLWFAVTVIGIFCVEAAKNASGEIFDWDSGTDPGIRDDERTPFSGGKRVIVDGLLGRREVAIIAGGFYVLGAAAGLAIVALREPRVLWVGIVGFALAFFYHAPPFKLAYRGLGELAIALAYGPVVTCGTYLVQRHTLSPGIILLSLPLLFAQATCISYCEFPDSRSDAEAGKRTLVVRLGRERAARLYPWLAVVTYASLAVLPFFGITPAVLVGFAGLPLVIRAARHLARHYDSPAALTPGFPFALNNFVVLALGMSLGLLFG